MLDKQALDRYLTTEPDNGYTSWLEDVWDRIPEDIISAEEYDKNEKFFDDGAQKLALSGKNGFVKAQFAADVIINRFRLFKNNPNFKTWADVQNYLNGQYLPKGIKLTNVCITILF